MLPNTPASLSRHLRIRVVNAGQVRVDLTFNAPLAADLPALVPTPLLDTLQTRGIDVSKIAADASVNRFAPGELFQHTEGPKQVRVWLE